MSSQHHHGTTTNHPVTSTTTTSPRPVPEHRLTVTGPRPVPARVPQHHHLQQHHLDHQRHPQLLDGGSSAPDSIGPLVGQSNNLTHGTVRRGSLSTTPYHPGTQHPAFGNHGSQRGSLAKIHDMNKEAPITKVQSQIVGILSKLKDREEQQECEIGFDIRSELEQVLENIKCPELYTPMELQPYSKDSFIGEGIAQDLVEGLMRPSQTSHRRSSAGETHLQGRSRGLSNPVISTAGRDRAVPDNWIQPSLVNYEQWDWNILELEEKTDKKPLRYLGMKIFREFEMPLKLQIDEATLDRWLVMMESNYLESNPYHNSTHAADVLGATAFFLRTERCRNLLTDFDIVASLIAATIHDVDHPGRTNAFLCNSRHELALLYNDTAVLENHHVAKSFKLTLDPERQANIFSNLNLENYQTIRSNVIDMVLATELGKHFEHVNKFISSTRVDNDACLDGSGRSPRQSTMALNNQTSLDNNEDAELRTLVKRVLIKVADVSNPARPRQACIEWTRRICEEYFEQTAEETAKSLPIVMPTFRREVCSIPKTQTAFINYFLLDMFDAWHEFCDVPVVRDQLKDNLKFWDEMDSKGLTTIEEILEHATEDDSDSTRVSDSIAGTMEVSTI